MDRIELIIKKEDLEILDGRHDGSYHIYLKRYGMDSIADICVEYYSGMIMNRKESHHWTYNTQSKELSIYLEHLEDIEFLKFVYYSIKHQREIKIKKLLEE